MAFFLGCINSKVLATTRKEDDGKVRTKDIRDIGIILSIYMLRLIIPEQSNRKFIQCPNPECKHRWEYRGRLLFYASCPSCRKNLKIKDNQILEGVHEIGIPGNDKT